VVDPGALGMPGGLDWDPIADGTSARSARFERRPHYELAAVRPRALRDTIGAARARVGRSAPARNVPQLWIDLVKHDTRQRHYEELLSDEHLTAWLICWMDDHDTGFHDHDASAGAVAVVSGAVREERLTIDGPVHQRTVDAGDSFHFAAADIHRVRHAGNDPAVTLHAYSPPLLRMGAYVIGEDGALAPADVVRGGAPPARAARLTRRQAKRRTGFEPATSSLGSLRSTN
jgi:quercetin dioxygenase-like cupin family protein